MMEQPALFTASAGRPQPEAAATATELRVEIVAIPCGAGRTLLVAARPGADALILAPSFTDDDVVRALAGGITVPRVVLPELVRTLEQAVASQ